MAYLRARSNEGDMIIINALQQGATGVYIGQGGYPYHSKYGHSYECMRLSFLKEPIAVIKHNELKYS